MSVAQFGLFELYWIITFLDFSLCFLNKLSLKRKKKGVTRSHVYHEATSEPTSTYTGWRTKCHTIDFERNTFLLLQKRLTSGTQLILIGWKIVPNEEHVQCDHRFASQPLQTNPCIRHNFSAQVFRKRAAELHYVGPEVRYIVKLCRTLSGDLCRNVVTNARVRLQEVVRQNSGHIEHVLH